MASQSKLSPAGHRFFEAKGVHRVPCSPAAFRSIFNPKRLDKKISCWSFLSSIPRYQIFPKVVPPRCVSLFLTSNYVDISTKNPSTSYSEYNGVLGENGIPPFMDCGIPIYIYTLWLFNIAMENGPFIDGLPIKTSIYKGFSMAMLNNQRVYIYIFPKILVSIYIPQTNHQPITIYQFYRLSTISQYV